jgi:hypothetical protein
VNSLELHTAAYAQATALKRRQLVLGLLVLLVCVGVSGHIAEISISKFFDNIGPVWVQRQPH